MENQIPNCAVCGKPMNFIKAGVSRTTGKAYNAFWGCPDKCKQPKQDWVKPEVRTQYAKPTATKEATDWDKIAEGKVRNSIAVAFIGQGNEFSENTISRMNEWVKWIMKGSEEYPFNQPPF